MESNTNQQMYQNLLKNLFEGLNTIKIRRSALDPIIRAMLYFSLPCLGLLILAPEKIQILYFCLAATPVALFFIISMVFLFCDRNRFHTEEFLKEKHELEIAQSKNEGLSKKAEELKNTMDTEPSKKVLADKKKEDLNG